LRENHFRICSRTRRQNPAETAGRHRAGGGTVVRTTPTQLSSGSSPEISSASAPVTGASIPASRNAVDSSGTVSSDYTA